MRSTRPYVVPLLLAVLISAASLSVSAAAAIDRSSPRATFDSFLKAMVAVKSGQTGRIDDAVACFDLSSVSSVVRDQAPKLARDLKTWLDKTELIELESIPLVVDGNRWLFRRTEHGVVSLVRDEDGRWLFSSETIAALPALLDDVRGRAFVEGLEGGGGSPATLADWLRRRLPSALGRRVFVLEHWQWLALILLAFVGVVIDRLVRIVLGQWLKRMLARSARLRKKDLDANFEKPVGILCMAIVWWVLLPTLDLPLSALAVLRFAAQLMIAAAGVWAAYRLVDVVAAYLISLAARTESKVDDILLPLARRALKIIVIAFGLLFVAQNLDIDISSLLAGLGLGGLAFALAAKDTVENLFGSVTVLVDRPFQVGDWVTIEDLEGTVEEIGFRSTRIRTFYNSVITVPNSKLVNAAVDNLGVRRYRRVKCMIAVQYDTPAERIEAFCEGMRELIRSHPYTRKDYYMVYLNEFAGSSLNILFYAFFITPDWGTELREKHRLFVDIVRLAQRLGVQFAFPTQTLHLASVPPGSSLAAGAATSPPPADGSANAHEDAIRIGRDEARAIVETMWPAEAQPPVDFRDPERIRPGNG